MIKNNNIMSEIDTPTFTQTTSEDNLSLAKEIKKYNTDEIIRFL
jgi:hypothetical protein